MAGQVHVQAKLEEELERLTARLRLDCGLRVVWEPSIRNGFSGLVKDGTIHVYEADEEKALQTLRHEVLDYLVTSKIVEPLVNLVNLLVKSREADIYREKEKLVETLLNLID